MTDKKMIRILTSSSGGEAVEILKSELEGIASIELCEGDVYDCVVAFIDSDEKIGISVVTDVFEALARGKIIFPIRVTQDSEVDAHTVSSTVSTIKGMFCEDTPKTDNNSCDDYATLEELITSEENTEECTCELEESDKMQTTEEESEAELAIESEVNLQTEALTENSEQSLCESECVKQIEEDNKTDDVYVSDNALNEIKTESDGSTSEKCSCGADIVPDMMFCWSCGRKLYDDPEVQNRVADELPDVMSEKTKDEPDESSREEHSDENAAVAETPEHREDKVTVCSCGADIIPNTVFCWNCGRKLDTDVTPASMASVAPSHCSACGAEVSAGDKFCFACGKPIL